MDLSDERWRKVAGLLNVVDIIGKWPAATGSIMCHLFPNTVDSDGPSAPLATQIGYWDWVRVDVMEDTNRYQTSRKGRANKSSRRSRAHGVGSDVRVGT